MISIVCTLLVYDFLEARTPVCSVDHLPPALVPYAQKVLFTDLNECLLWKRSMKNKIGCSLHKVVIWRLSLLVF